MREGRDAERRLIRRQANQGVGLSHLDPRYSVEQLAHVGAVDEILAMPLDLSRRGDLQDSSGAFLYMVDVDGLDGAPLG